MAERNKDIKAKSAKIEKYREQNNELQLSINALEHDINKYQQETADASSTVLHNCAFLCILWPNHHFLRSVQRKWPFFFFLIISTILFVTLYVKKEEWKL